MILAELYMFGNIMNVIANTKEEAEEALMAEYEKMFTQINGEGPKTILCVGDKTYFDNAREGIIYEEMEIGKVRRR